MTLESAAASISISDFRPACTFPRAETVPHLHANAKIAPDDEIILARLFIDPRACEGVRLSRSRTHAGSQS